MTGRLIGVGTGPGDPELMTLKAVRALAEAVGVCAAILWPVFRVGGKYRRRK